jgi:DNA repair protein RadA/Sms
MATKTRERPAYSCSECGQTVGKWVGRCPECQAWGTIAEVGASTMRVLSAGAIAAPAQRIDAIDVATAHAHPTGVGELDRVLGGGLVPGAVVLLAGEPGVGKSTLLLEVAAQWSRDGATALIVSGEESTGQIRLRAGRTGALSPTLFIAAETDLGAVIGHVEQVQPSLLIVDSIQTVAHPDVDGGAGGVAQVRECAAALIRVAKSRGMSTVIVGHVTKDGGIAGPRLLEHLVDVVLHFEGDRHASLRLVRAVKNRYGAADEVGCFELTDGGIVGLPDPSGLFMSRRDHPVEGTCITVTVEGRRPMVAEMQALVCGTQAQFPRRAVSGLDQPRVQMLLAVLERQAELKLSDCEVYAATVGGVRISEPAADLAVALALASSKKSRALPNGLVAIGEVGLAGEVRRVGATGRRLGEAARLGFTTALIPAGSDVRSSAIDVIEVNDLKDALRACGLG